MATTTEKLILELQAKIEKYNRDILDATKKTLTFQKVTAKAFSTIEKDAKRVDKSLSSFAKGVKKSFDNVGKNVGKGGKSLTDFSVKAKKSLTSVQKDSNKAAKSVDKLSASIKKVPKKIGVRVDLKVKKIRDTNKALGILDDRAKQASGSLFRFSNVAKGVFAAIGARAFVNFADSITLADNQLRNVTANAEQFNFVQMELNRIAQETRQDVNELTGVFARFTRAGQEAGISQQDLLGFTENLTKAFKLEGNTTAEVNSTLIQLSQSFRKGRIDGEEFRALSENSTISLQALAKQLGVTIGELKELGAQGKIAPRDLIEGLKGIGDQIDAEFATLEPTFGELGTKLGNLLAKGFRESDAKTLLDNFKRDLSAGIDAIEFTFTDLGKKTFTQFELIEKIGVDAVGRILEKSKEIAELKSKIIVTTDIQEIDELSVKIKSLQRNIEEVQAVGKIGGDVDTSGIESINEEINKLIKSRQMLIDNNRIEFEGINQARMQIEELRKSIQGEAEGAGFFDRALFGTVEPLIRQLTILTVALEEAKIAAAVEPSAEAEATRKPIVAFGAPEKLLIERGKRRLTIIGDISDAERQLLAEVDEGKISEAEARELLANQKELDRVNEQFQKLLERVGTNKEEFEEFEKQFEEGRFQRITDDELKLLELSKASAKAKEEITKKSLQKIAKIQDIARRNELATTLTTGGRILAAISNLATKGTAIQKTAARASIIFNTASGIVRQFNDLPFPQAVGTSIAVALEGAAALSAIGGGGGSSPTVSASGSSPEEEEAIEATPTLDVSVTEISDEGTAGSRLIIDASAGTSSDQFLADAWNDAVRTGRITGRGL